MVTLFQTLHTLSYVVVHRIDDHLKAVKEEKGATAVEYAILVGIIAAVLVTVVTLFGNRLRDRFAAIIP